MNEIVVGVDLSPSAHAAITWAAEQARATGRTLRAVNAVDISPDFNLELGMGAVTVPVEAAAMNAPYREAVSAIFDSVQPELGWALQFFSGEAGPVLVAQSQRAAMLVVGTKEHVGIGRLITGSVSHYCLSHARCPIVAVPAGFDDGTGQDHDAAAADVPAPA